jgi:hypothetical protein
VTATSCLKCNALLTLAACRQQARGPFADANRGLPGDAPSSAAQRGVRQTNDAAVLHAKDVVLLGKFVPSAATVIIGEPRLCEHPFG